MLFKPKWVKLLPAHLEPDEKRIRELEKLRIEFNIPHDTLMMRIMCSPTTTRKVQKQCLENFRVQKPGASEKELLRMVLISRIQTPPALNITELEINQAMEEINSFDALCKYIIALDEQDLADPDPLGIGKRIDEILTQEELDNKSLSENLIKSLEQTYFDLRKKSPDQDEHWFLANTWLKRYGSIEQAKQKGPKLLKFIAYKETHQFSILEPPDSIRGLALFLVYKELGEQQAMYYNRKFSHIMETIIKSRENHMFLDRYKQRNPRTWKENQIEDKSPYSLYYFLKGLEFEQKHPEEAKKLWDKIENNFKRNK